jgi:hypothetical protein
MTFLARIASGAARLIAALVVAGILLYVFDANEGNAIVGAVMDVARFFADPFDSIFEMDDNKVEIAVNWGIGAAAYLAVGMLLARLFAGVGAGAGRTRARLGRRRSA